MLNRWSLGSNAVFSLPLMMLLAVLSLSGCGGGGEEAETGSATMGASLAPDTIAPSVPGDVSADAVSSAQIDLAWAASTDNRAVTGYRILRNGSEIATLDNVTEFEDTGLSASTQYSYTIEAVDGAGNVSGQSAVTLATTPAPDSTPPTVSSVSTEDAPIPVAVNSAITVDFSTPVAKSTVNPQTFKVETRGGSPIAGDVSVRGNTATFTPSAGLPADTEHTATVTTDVTDTAGNSMAATFATTFVTAAVADTAPPTVSSTFPANAATGIALNITVSVAFSEAMTNATLTTSSVSLKETSSGTAVGGKISVSGKAATFVPSANLKKSTQYTATITTAAKDAAGNSLGANYSWTFVTGTAVDSTAPKISATDPANGLTGVALNNSVKARFSEAMLNSSLTTASFKLKVTSSGTAVSGTVQVNGVYAEFIPSAALAANTQYTAAVTIVAKDAARNPLAASFTWKFTTGAVLDTTLPTVLSTSPKYSATGVPPGSTISATFSSPMRSSTLTTASVVVKNGSGTAIAGTVSVNSTIVTFTPLVALTGGAQYTATITTAAKDTGGNSLAADYLWSFTTAAATTTAALEWDAVTAANLSGYRVYYGLSPGTYIQARGQGIGNGKATTHTVAGLNRGIRYYFSVTAFDTSGNESDYADEVFKDIP